MTAYEMLLSESQERMLIVAHAGREREVVDIFRKWDLDAVVIGRVRDTKRMQVIHNGQMVADIPIEALTDEAPRYDRPKTSAFKESAPLFVVSERQKDQDYTQNLLTLLSSGNIASKQWVFRQYDHMVRTNTAVLPGADAAVVRIKETRRALAMTLDGNGRYCAANPREGAKLVVAEAARNVVCVGARPIAVTNCLNFASPEKPEVMWAFSEVVDGMAEACRVFETPVVSGNVSFYNETEGRGILPTPVIGMVGLIEDVRRVVQPGFKNQNDVIALLGVTGDDLIMSEYSVSVLGKNPEEFISSNAVPQLDLDLERRVQAACLQAAEAGLVRSAHDCSDGGLAVAIAECCFSSAGHEAIGADIDLGQASTKETLLEETLLFSESPSRIVVSFDPDDEESIRRIAETNAVPFAVIGRVGGDRLTIKTADQVAVDASVAQLENTWRGGLTRMLQPEALSANQGI
jgi:phosphoribosylformylglycinamidine synthase